MGALIMAHGDDAGLRLPPRLAPVQVVVLAVRTDEAPARRRRGSPRSCGRPACGSSSTSGPRTCFGRRVVDWELKGVPVRVEIGPRDLAEDKAVVVRHDRSKTQVQLAGLVPAVTEALGDTARALHAEAQAFRNARMTTVATLDEALSRAGSAGFGIVPWSEVGDPGEDRLAEAGITVRCLQRPDGTLAEDGAEGEPLVAVVGKSY